MTKYLSIKGILDGLPLEAWDLTSLAIHDHLKISTSLSTAGRLLDLLLCVNTHATLCSYICTPFSISNPLTHIPAHHHPEYLHNHKSALNHPKLDENTYMLIHISRSHSNTVVDRSLFRYSRHRILECIKACSRQSTA